jgi:multidrug resistance efflux pump
MPDGVLAGGRCAMLGAWLALAACASREPPQFAGFLDAPIADVAAQVAGRVESIPVREGDRVAKGQVLAQLDAREREAQAAQARANLEQAREALKEAEANLGAVLPTVGGAGADIARAQATLDEAELNFTRTEQLVKGSAAPAQQLDAARARLLEARAALQSLTAGKAAVRGKVGAAVAAVSNARAAVGVSQAAVQVAEVQLAQARVLCPFDGVVVERDLEEGEWAAPGTPVVTVEDHERLWVRLDVEETRLGGLHLGQEVRVKVMAFPARAYRGRVAEIGAQGDFAVNRDVKRGRPDIRTFRVRVTLDERSDELRPGMTAEVSLALAAPARPSAPPVAAGR